MRKLRAVLAWFAGLAVSAGLLLWGYLAIVQGMRDGGVRGSWGAVGAVAVAVPAGLWVLGKLVGVAVFGAPRAAAARSRSISIEISYHEADDGNDGAG